MVVTLEKKNLITSSVSPAFNSEHSLKNKKKVSQKSTITFRFGDFIIANLIQE